MERISRSVDFSGAFGNIAFNVEREVEKKKKEKNLTMIGSPPPSLHICCHPPSDTVPMAKYKIQHVAMQFTYKMDSVGHYRSFSDIASATVNVLDLIVAKNLP